MPGNESSVENGKAKNRKNSGGPHPQHLISGSRPLSQQWRHLNRAGGVRQVDTGGRPCWVEKGPALEGTTGDDVGRARPEFSDLEGVGF